MTRELILFLWSILYGVIILFFYDWIRSLRMVIEHGKILITIEDFIFWIAVGIFLFHRLYCNNGGILRGYFFAGILLGMVFYTGTISRFVIKFVSFLLKRLKLCISWVKIVLCKVLIVDTILGIMKRWGKWQKRKKEEAK